MAIKWHSWRFSARLALVLALLVLLTPLLLAQQGGARQRESARVSAAQEIGKADERVIEFAGRRWGVKSGCGLGPGPNCWSDSEQSVWVEGGRLHLKLRQIDGVWHSAEVYSQACAHYGVHRFFLIGRLDQLDKNVVAAPFLYRDDWTEIDIEFAEWGEDDPPANAQYVVQPADAAGHRHRFPMALTGDYTTHVIDWRASAILFQSIHGHYLEPPDAAHLIQEWLYTGNDIPAQEACLRIHINLWLYQGVPPADGQEVEVVVKNVHLPVPVSAYLPELFVARPAP